MLNTMTAMDDPKYAHIAFREASCGGGSAPRWTECGDYPSDWDAPPDAAGGLILWDELGRVLRASPITRALGPTAESVINDMCADDEYFAARIAEGCIVRATYASSGGRVICLLQEATDLYWVCVFRPGDTPLPGCSEANITRMFPEANVIVIDDSVR